MTGDADRDGIGGDTPQADDKPDGPELDIEAAFEALARQFRVPTADGEHPWPAAEDLGPDERPDHIDTLTIHSTEPDAGPAPAPPRRAVNDRSPGPGHRAEPEGPAAGHSGEPLYPRELDDHYVPPEPPPLPRGDLVSRLAWGGVIGGPLFLLFAALIGGDMPAVLLLAALGAFIGGFVTLVARMPGEPPEDRDDGAVV